MPSNIIDSIFVFYKNMMYIIYIFKIRYINVSFVFFSKFSFH